MITELYEHQKADIKFIKEKRNVLNFSDPGTGKTRTSIEIIKENPGRTLVVCPKTIIETAWRNDIQRFAPHLRANLAYAGKREKAFTDTSSKVVITNHDAATWLLENQSLLKGFTQLIIDESTAFKNPTTSRTKAMLRLAQYFDETIAMSGTPLTNTVLDLWSQTFIVDKGARLGQSCYRFRDEVCTARTLANGIRIWEDKPGIDEVVFHLIKDITIRHKLNECVSIPDNTTNNITFTMNNKHRTIYKRMLEDRWLEFQDSEATAVNIAVLTNKLLQIASGAVYTNTGYEVIDTDRYDLIAQLVEERQQCIIAIQWRHQREELLKRIKNCQVIDGSVSQEQRNQYVNNFQQGHTKTLLIHPRSGAHGLTLTAGTTTLWASPIYSSELDTQLNQRINRIGQTQKTETIRICAKDTIDQNVVNVLEQRITRANTLLQLIAEEYNRCQSYVT